MPAPVPPPGVLTVALPTGREPSLQACDGLRRAVRDLDEWALLGASGCHGWARLVEVALVASGPRPVPASCPGEPGRLPVRG